MKFKILFITLLISNIVFSQLKISGVIKDEQNQPVPFVNVYIKGTTFWTHTSD